MEYLLEFLNTLIFGVSGNVIQAEPSLLLPLLFGGLSLAGNAFTGIKAAQQGDKMNKFINNRSNELTGWFKNNYYKDFMESDTALSALSGLRSQMSDSLKNMSGNAVKSGSTTEKNVAGRGELMSRYAQAISQLMGYGTNYKRGIHQDYMRSMSGLDALKLGQMQQNQQSWSNVGSNFTNSLSSLGSLFDVNGPKDTDTTIGKITGGFKGQNTGLFESDRLNQSLNNMGYGKNGFNVGWRSRP